jgi:four helix bundle protein
MQEIEMEHPEGDTDELRILNKIIDMMADAEPILNQYPRYERYGRVLDIKRCMDTMMERAIEANKKFYKKTTLQDMDVAVDKLRHYIRLSYRLRFIDYKKYKRWTAQVNEIGKMLGKWIMSTKK